MADIINESIETVALSKLREHPANPRQGDVGAVSQSIDASGFFGVVVAQRSTGYVLAGNHRLKAARALGMDALPVAYVDVDDDRAMRILLADNRTSDLGTYDNAALVQLLDHLASTDAGLGGTGYSTEAYGDLLASFSTSASPAAAANDPAAEWEGMPEYEDEDKRPFRSLHLHFRSESDVSDFRAIVGQDFTDEAKWIWHPRQVRNDFMAEQWAANADES
jgi:hypothetical protein